MVVGLVGFGPVVEVLALAVEVAIVGFVLVVVVDTHHLVGRWVKVVLCFEVVL